MTVTVVTVVAAVAVAMVVVVVGMAVVVVAVVVEGLAVAAVVAVAAPAVAALVVMAEPLACPRGMTTSGGPRRSSTSHKVGPRPLLPNRNWYDAIWMAQ